MNSLLAYQSWEKRIRRAEPAESIVAWRKGNNACIRLKNPKMPEDRYATVTCLHGDMATKVRNVLIRSGMTAPLGMFKAVWFDETKKGIRITVRADDSPSIISVVSRDTAKEVYNAILAGAKLIDLKAKSIYR